MTFFAMMIRRIDWILFLSVMVLTALGLLGIWSVDLAQDPTALSHFKKQFFVVIGGIAISVLGALMDYRVVRSLARLLYVGGLILLAALFVFGVTIRGTQGWFQIGGFTFQPVEIAKLFLVIGLAKHLDRYAHIVDWQVLTRVGIIAGAYVGLTIIQPDFGSALVLLAIAVGLLLMTNVPRRYLVSGGALMVVLAFTMWMLVLKDYQKDRILTVIDPNQDPFGSGYNIRQSVIAVGAGGLFGRGLGEGSQSQLRFLPEAQTDFIFAVIAEQFGFLGVVLLLGAYGVIVIRLVLICQRTRDGFAQFCVIGFLILIVAQAILNVGMNIGLLPIVGLPLPFVSLGGSALLANFLMLGLVQSIRVRG